MSAYWCERTAESSPLEGQVAVPNSSSLQRFGASPHTDSSLPGSQHSTQQHCACVPSRSQHCYALHSSLSVTLQPVLKG
eukprot:9510-Heterococcus_DN1.PRE.1